MKNLVTTAARAIGLFCWCFPGEYLDRCEQSRFASLSLSRRKDPNNPRSDLEYFKVEGRSRNRRVEMVLR